MESRLVNIQGEKTSWRNNCKSGPTLWVLVSVLLKGMSLHSHLKHNWTTKIDEALGITPSSCIFPRLNTPRLADRQNKNEQTWKKRKEEKKKWKEKSLSFWWCNCVFSLWTSERSIHSYSEWEKATETGGLLLDPLNKRFMHYISILRQLVWSFFPLFYDFIEKFWQ